MVKAMLRLSSNPAGHARCLRHHTSSPLILSRNASLLSDCQDREPGKSVARPYAEDRIEEGLPGKDTQIHVYTMIGADPYVTDTASPHTWSSTLSVSLRAYAIPA